MSESETTRKRSRRRAKWWRPVILLVGVVAIIAAAWALGLGSRIRQMRGWIDSLGAWGPLVYVLIYAGATVAALPGSVLTVAAGALFGSVLGVIVVSVASTLGASLSFLVARYFARDSVEQWLGGSERFRKLNDLSEGHGQIVVAITRLVPIFPFNFLNYAFGLTRVKFWTYVFWSWLCMLPATIVYVVGTDAVTRAITERRVPWALLAAVAAVIVILTLLVSHARGTLAQTRHAQAAGAQSPEGEGQTDG